jgi:ribosomal-protein-alanine N-acetyltransferase
LCLSTSGDQRQRLNGIDELIIRDMRKTDIPSILKIERISFSSPWTKDSFLNEIKNPYAILKVVISVEVIIGYICARHILDECHILNLAVHPEFRRRGIATLLLRELMNESIEKGSRFYDLEVRISNIAAQKFYENFGFRIVGRRKKYYHSPNEDAALMVCEI